MHIQKLEPWLVSGVQVLGDVELVSALAKGLPVSEDLDLVIDVDHLKAPQISNKRLVMLIGVFSSCNNFDRRMALRRSWMQYEAVRSGEVAVRFFTGLVSDASQTGVCFYHTKIVFFCLPSFGLESCNNSSLQICVPYKLGAYFFIHYQTK